MVGVFCQPEMWAVKRFFIFKKMIKKVKAGKKKVGKKRELRWSYRGKV